MASNRPRPAAWCASARACALGRAEITIDNSVERAASRPGHGLALTNVRERLRLMHDLDAQFEIQRDDAATACASSCRWGTKHDDPPACSAS